MRGTGFDARIWDESGELDPNEQRGGFCVLCEKDYETGADWDAHIEACMDSATVGEEKVGPIV